MNLDSLSRVSRKAVIRHKRLPLARSPDVRAKLGKLIEFVKGRADEFETQAGMTELPGERGRLMILAEHQLGRLHGLQEAQEMLELLGDGAGQ